MNLINLLTLPDIDPLMISTISNLVFVGIIVLVLLGGLIGLLRGVWNASFRLIFVGLLVILSYALAGRIGDGVANIDLTIFGFDKMSINDMTVNVTTIKGTLIEIIGAIGTNEGGSLQKTLSDPRTLALITELAMIVVRFATFLVLAVIVIIFGNLLATLLYHLIFKHLIAKKLRKEVKLRMVGFAEGIVKSSLVLSMLIVPFSSIINSISKAFNNANVVKKENLDNETYNQLMEWVDAYNKSALAQVLFNWTKDSDGNTLDMKLANVITSTSESTLTFTDEISSILSVGTTLLASGAADFAEDGSLIINGTILMDSSIISILIAQLTTSSLVMNALPIVADFALNMDGVSEYIDASKVDLDKIDWKNDLTTLSNIYSDMYETGIVDEEVLSNPSIMVKRILNTEDESIHTKLVKTFEKFDELEIMRQVLPSLVWTMANTEGNVLQSYLPTEWEKYQNIKFGNEFATVYDSIYRINKTTENALVDYVDEIIASSDTKNLKSLKYENDAEQDKTKNDSVTKFLDAILTNAKEIVPIFVGERDNDTNEFLNVDKDGKLTNGRCLLDSDLLVNSFGKLSSSLVNLVISNLGDMKIDSTKIDEAVKSLETRLDYKLEFGTMLDIVADIVSDENTKDLFTSDTITLTEEICESLKTPLSTVDNSKILKAAIPEILRSVVNTNANQLEEFGISPDSIYYEVDSLGDELVNVLDFTPALFNVVKAMTKDNVQEQLEAIDSNDLTNILHGVKKSEIFNHKFSDRKENFLIVIDNLFDKLEYKDGNITDHESLVDLNWDKEIDNIGNFFDTFKECKFTKLLNNPNGYLDREVLDPDSVSSLFNSIGDSALLSVGLGPILDNNLKEMLDSIPNANLSFRNVIDWSTEGENFAILLDSAQRLNEKGTTLDNIDFVNSDAVDEDGNLLTRNLAVALSKSQLFGDEYGFGNFLKNQLTEANGNLNFHDIDNPEELTKTTQFFNEVSSDRKWEEEIDVIFNFIKAMQNIGEDNGAVEQKGNAGLDIIVENPQDYTDLFIADGSETLFRIEEFKGINSSNALRMVIANAIKDAASEDFNEFGDVDLKVSSRLNVQALVDMDDVDERNHEMKTVCDALKKVQDLDGVDFAEVRNDDEKLSNLEDTLVLLHESKMFNTLNNENLENEADATTFEGIVAEFLKVTINEDAILGKLNEDMKLKCNSTLEVVQSISNSRCTPDVDSNDDWVIKGDESVSGEIAKMFETIRLADGVDFDDIGGDDCWLENNDNLDEIMHNLNDSNVLYRTIPYFINKFINEKNTDSFSPDFSLKAAKPGFSYNEYTKEFDHYDDSEINRLVTIMDNFSLLEDTMEDDFTLKTIKEGDNEENLKDTLKALANSDVFHVQGSNEEGKDTVFIQVMCLSFNDSTLSDTIYDTKLYQEQYDALGITNAQENARTKILSFDEETKANKKYWNNEIDNIFDIYDQIIDINDDEIEQVGDINIKRMNPDQIDSTLKTINLSDLCYDAVPIYIRKAFENVSLSNFSKYDGENKENYLIGRDNYYINSEETPDANEYELDVIHELLIGIVKYDESYEDGYARKANGDIEYVIEFKNGFKISEFKAHDRSLTTFVQFLIDSKIFKDCRGLVMKNAIDSVGFAEYISDRYDGTYVNSQQNRFEYSNVLDAIFDKIENIGDRKQIIVEGTALDSITDTLETLIKDSKAGENTFTSLDSKAISKVFRNCYIYNDGSKEEYIKSYLSCEIVAGFLSSNIEDSNYLDDYYCSDEHNIEYQNMWYFGGKDYSIENDFAYNLFNDLETNALASSIDSVKLVSKMGDPKDITTEQAEQMTNLLSALYDENSKENSTIASFVYRKGIYNRLMNEGGVFYVAHSVLINNDRFNNAYNDMLENCSDPIKDSNFSFEKVQNNVGIMFDEIIKFYSAF
ncbi:MAG: hypothetical protein J1F32_01050 [Erysipelotrichales bacterium]|nr:hypothetical protein [Erysipelotrichales bacterium]